MPATLPTEMKPTSSPPFWGYLQTFSSLPFIDHGADDEQKEEAGEPCPRMREGRGARVLGLLIRCLPAHPPDALSPLHWGRDTAPRSIGKTWGLPFRPSTLIPVRAKPKPNAPPGPKLLPPAVAPRMTTHRQPDHREQSPGLERPIRGRFPGAGL